MKRFLLVLPILLLITVPLFSQETVDGTEREIDVYMLTCGPGPDVYATWGHSAIRVVDHNAGTDIVYNWGVFDFSTKHFGWKFAKGRLEYMLASTSYENFMREYIYYKRYVKSQKVNLEPEEIDQMLLLINENLKPENVKYRYDFFYDDCSTRIRDLFENIIGNKFLYPPNEKETGATYSQEIGNYTKYSPWLDLGIDLLMGREGQINTTLRDRMFLPEGLSEGLAQVVVNRGGMMVPLLANPIMVLEGDETILQKKTALSPLVVFSAMFILIVLLSIYIKSVPANNIFDITLFFIFSLLSGLMLFFNFFTDHQQMKMNMDIIWLSPFVIICLFSLIFNKELVWSFKSVFILCVVYAVAIMFLPNSMNISLLPLVLSLALRSMVRSDYKWNPLKLRTF